MQFLVDISRYALPVLAIVILALSTLALLRRKPQEIGNVSLINTVSGDSYEIVNRETSIGRHKDCDILLNYPTVSRHHAVIICGKDAWYIYPVSKDVPVKLNGKVIDKNAILSSGDRISLGEVNLMFVR